MPAKIDQWVTIKDFRPGIKGRVFPSQVLHRAGEVLGAAAPDNTYGCWALPDGSLAPLPSNTTSFGAGASTPVNPTLCANGRVTIGGFAAIGPIQTGFETHMAYEAKLTSDSKRKWYWTRVRHFAADQVDILKSVTNGAEGTIGTFNARPTWLDAYRANTSDPTSPGLPGIVCGWYPGGGGTDRQWLMFPDPAASTTDTPLALSTGLDPSISFVHQGRAIVFDQDSYNHGANSYVWTHNENIWFTKANLTTLDVTKAQTFGMENAAGYVFAVSHNHQECFLMKHGGGGMIVRGDFLTPTVLRLPGIQPGTSLQKPCVTPVGVVYLDPFASGAWLWSGGETAENISRDAIDADLFNLGYQGAAGGESGTVTDFLDFAGQMCYWRDWVFFPNNWMWNYKDGSWWRLESSSTHYMHYTVAPNNQQYMIAAPAIITSTSDLTEFTYDYGTPRQSYRWTSLPFAIGDNSMVTIRELVLVASGKGTVTVTFTDVLGNTEAHALTIATGATPSFMRDNCHMNCQELRVQIDVAGDGSTSVPVIHEVRMGVQGNTHYPLRTV